MPASIQTAILPLMSRASPTQRIVYVDRLRGLAVAAMFFVHTAGAWLTPSVREHAYWTWAMRVSGMVAPVFMFLVGISMVMVARRARIDGRNETSLRRRIALRGMKIIALGYGLHLCFWVLGGLGGSWERVLKVDILHSIGLAMIVFSAIAWPRGLFNWKALALFLMIPVLGQVAFRMPVQEWMPEGLAAYFTTRTKLALFPFVPYGTWVALGLFVGPLWASALETPDKERRFWIGLVVAAIVMYGAGKGFRWVYYQSGWHRLGGDDIPTKGLVYLFFVKGAIVLALFTAMRATAGILDRVPWKTMVLLGRVSLFAYCVHLIIIYHVAGRFCNKALLPAQQALGTVFLAIVMYGICFAWSRWPTHGRFGIVKGVFK
ncbi:MAG: DUF1624 domain-containing protein [Deltaproteobacteria bacterium]|nr:DUF1624 domain-containing protein [Deltaproteobacteria bacterium]